MHCITSAELLLRNPDDAIKKRRVEFEALMRELSSLADLEISYVQFRRLLRDERTVGSFLVADNDSMQGLAVATYIVTSLGDVMWIQDIVVTSALRRKGFGAMLVKHLMQQSKSSNFEIEKWVLDTRPERDVGGFYEALGFQRLSVDRYYL